MSTFRQTVRARLTPERLRVLERIEQAERAVPPTPEQWAWELRRRDERAEELLLDEETL